MTPIFVPEGTGGQPARQRERLRAEQGRCRSCGQRRGRAHYSFCRAQQDREAEALRSRGMVVNDCGCSGLEHKSTTCTRFYEFYPDAEIGEEYAGGFDG